MNVHWTRTAQEHLDAIYAYIAIGSPRYALRMIDRLTGRSQQLGLFPFSGRMLPDYGNDDIHELIEGSYRIIYRVLPDRIDVLAVIHGAREITTAFKFD
ncbi:MAG: type II toxin-antitoxin system RelE/ParE family toxin [Nitrospirae bacterium]|nr:type II toxin-antitoxin system RelE/ParE family toxin [Nitrospirota bacterium]